MAPADAEHLQLECVRISSAGAAEMDGERPLLFLPRAEIMRMELHRGSAAERPLVCILLGVVLMAIAITPLVLLPAAWRSGVRFPTSAISAVVFAFPGWWLLDLAVRKRFYLAVTTRRETRKVVFHKTADARTIEEFVAAAKSRFGYA